MGLFHLSEQNLLFIRHIAVSQSSYPTGSSVWHWKSPFQCWKAAHMQHWQGHRCWILWRLFAFLAEMRTELVETCPCPSERLPPFLICHLSSLGRVNGCHRHSLVPLLIGCCWRCWTCMPPHLFSQKCLYVSLPFHWYVFHTEHGVTRSCHEALYAFKHMAKPENRLNIF